MADPRWRLKVVDIAPATNRYGFVQSASIVSLTFTLNGLDSVEFTFNAYDPSAALLLARVGGDPDETIVGYQREVEVWLDGKRLLQGPIETLRVAADGTCRARAFGFPWWIMQRSVGRADRTNLLPNGGFETGDFTSWSTFGSPNVVTNPVEVGTYAAALNVGDEIWQTFTYLHTYPGGLEPRFALSAFWPTGDDAPINDIWFEIEASDNPGVPTQIAYEPSSIDRDRWISFRSFGLGRPLPPNVPWDVLIRLRGPTPVGSGTIYYDSIRANQPESTGAPAGAPADVAAVGTLLVDYFQDPANGKDDVGITGVTHATGQFTTTVWQAADHEQAQRAFAQLTDRGTCDWWADYSVGGGRTWHFGARGTRKPEHRLKLGRNVATMEVTFDGRPAKNSVTVIGVGADFTRDEGGFVAVSGRPVTERIEHAPVSMPIGEYDLWAETLAEAGKNPVESADVATTWDLSILADVEPGDTVPIVADIGEFSTAHDARIYELRVDVASGRVVPQFGAAS